MDNDPVRLLLVLDVPGALVTWTPVCERWMARRAMRDFAEGVP